MIFQAPLRLGIPFSVSQRFSGIFLIALYLFGNYQLYSVQGWLTERLHKLKSLFSPTLRHKV